jgi:hydrogenase nickel insertion protein HypA
MHEYSIAQALLERVETEARTRGAIAVHRLRLRLGELSGVESGLLESAFLLCRERTICAGAALEIEPVGAAWTCTGCGRAIEPGEVLRCRDCGRPARLRAGDEIILDRIEMEVP